MVQRTVLKVDISCQKCKKKILKAVSTLEGVDKIEVDEAKGTLTVTGNVDPYKVIIRTRKAGKHNNAEVISIGPPPPPPKPPQDQAQKKPEDNKKADQQKKTDEKQQQQQPQIHHFHDPLSYPQYPQRVVFVPMGYDSYNQPNPSCSIM
ncbi:Heavy metal transport/detoxification superfamily protein [Euphorbia peplus]|nr:Heavy metal transport/detoxification superfamily protein [Euphorbia peplus]